MLAPFLIVVLLFIPSTHSFIHRTPRARTIGQKRILSPSSSSILFAGKPPADKDFISSFFSKFLPTPEDIGLSRYDVNSRPENYPAIKDKFADLLPSDNGDAKIIRGLLKNTNLEKRELQCVYNANKDGYDKTTFHKKVDKLGPAVVLCRSKSGGVFGGYNPTGWVNYGEYRGSIAAFLYMFPGGDTSTPSRAIKLQKIGGAGLAQIDDGSGPRFGPEGLTILLEKNKQPKKVLCKLGPYYERMPSNQFGSTSSLLPGGVAEDELVDLQVWVGVYASDEKIPYNDAIPFALN